MTVRDVQRAPGAGDSSLRESLAGLRGAQKSRRGVSVYSVFVNRPGGRYLAAAADVLRRTPNQVSVLSGLFSLAALVLLVSRRPTPAVGVVAALVLAVSFALDSADGQLARLRRAASPAGEWLDHMIDCATKLALHSVVLIAWYRYEGPGAKLLLPLAYLFIGMLLFFGGILVGKLRDQKSAAAGAVERPVRWWYSVLMLPVDHGILCCSFVLWGWPGAFRWAYVVLLAANAAYLCAVSTTWYRELSR